MGAVRLEATYGEDVLREAAQFSLLLHQIKQPLAVILVTGRRHFQRALVHTRCTQ